MEQILETRKLTHPVKIGSRVYVNGGEQSNGIILDFDDVSNVFIKLDSDGEVVVCSPNMLSDEQ